MVAMYLQVMHVFLQDKKKKKNFKFEMFFVNEAFGIRSSLSLYSTSIN